MWAVLDGPMVVACFQFRTDAGNFRDQYWAEENKFLEIKRIDVRSLRYRQNYVFVEATE